LVTVRGLCETVRGVNVTLNLQNATSAPSLQAGVGLTDREQIS